MKTATFFITITIVMVLVYFGYKPPQTIVKTVPKVVERIVEVEKIVEVPRVEEKIVEVPVVVEKTVELEKVVEVPKVVERIVEVPVEKKEVMAADSADSYPSTGVPEQRIVNAPVFASPYAPRPYYQPNQRIGGRSPHANYPSPYYPSPSYQPNQRIGGYHGQYVSDRFQYRNFHPGMGGFRRGR